MSAQSTHHKHGTGSKVTSSSALPSTTSVTLPVALGAKASLSDIHELARVKAALRHANERLEVIEGQLKACRHSTAALRATTGIKSGAAPVELLELLDEGKNASSLAGSRCAESVQWAQHVGVVRRASFVPLNEDVCALVSPGAWTCLAWQVRHPELYPGLNVSSPAAAFQLHLHTNMPSSRCTDPRTGVLMQEVMSGPSEGLASMLLLLGVLVCAICNAYSLGYLQPNRVIRSALRTIGCPSAPLVR